MSIVKDFLYIFILLILFFLLKKNAALKSTLFNQRETFIQILSHDIRVSALAQIRGLELLDKNNQDEELIKEINESAKYSLEMINMLLNTYQYENGKQILNYQKNVLLEIIEAKVQQLQKYANEKNIKFYYGKNLNKSICADKTELSKVFYYVISTAIFNSEKNNIIAISAKDYYSCMEISITYCGASLSEEECKRMFLNTPRFSTVGHGIKMYMCKKIIEFHGGKISVKNLKDRINVFTFTIPKRECFPLAKSSMITTLEQFQLSNSK